MQLVEFCQDTEVTECLNLKSCMSKDRLIICDLIAVSRGAAVVIKGILNTVTRRSSQSGGRKRLDILYRAKRLTMLI